MHLSKIWKMLSFIHLLRYCDCFIEPIITSYLIADAAIITISGISAYIGGTSLYCSKFECCREPWIKFSYSALKRDLNRQLFGQHLVNQAVLMAVSNHVDNPNPPKALVLSFNGWTGSGKNYAAKMIAQSLYKEGMHSKYVRLYITTKDFPHSSQSSQYFQTLKKDLDKAANSCERLLFIFDEIDKMPSGVIDAIQPYIEEEKFRKNIFIFLSNAGGHEINKIALNFFVNGKNREDIKMSDIQPLIDMGTFNAGGLAGSSIGGKNLVDKYVPFLPLEKEHVKKCLQVELNSRKMGFSERDLDSLADRLQYFDDHHQVFSKSGCKKVAHVVNYYFDL